MAKYHAIADSVRAAIAGGHYPLGSRLPGERKLSQEYGVAPGTIRQALAELVTEGALASRQGSRKIVMGVSEKTGTFAEFRSFAQWAWSRGRTPSGQVISAQWQVATSYDREQLRIDAGRVYSVLRIRGLDGEPTMVERTRYSPRVGERVEQIPDDCASVTIWLADEAAIVFARAEHRFSACSASAEDARHLQVRRGAPLLSHHRISFDQNGTPLEWSEDRYIAGGVSLVVGNSTNSNVLRWA